jgi:hypothetical protein
MSSPTTSIRITAPSTICQYHTTRTASGVCGQPATTVRDLGDPIAYALCDEHAALDAQDLGLGVLTTGTDGPVLSALMLYVVDEGDAQYLADNIEDAIARLADKSAEDWERYRTDWLVVWAVSDAHAVEMAKLSSTLPVPLDAIFCTN